MPKKPADKWEHEFNDLRLGGFQFSFFNDSGTKGVDPKSPRNAPLTKENKSYLDKLHKDSNMSVDHHGRPSNMSSATPSHI